MWEQQQQQKAASKVAAAKFAAELVGQVECSEW